MILSFDKFKQIILESIQNETNLEEGVIDSEKLYFHGSENGNIKTLNKPTPEKPLFVTADIDYANEYIQAAHPNGHAKFDEDENPGKVYLINLDFDEIKMFDGTVEEDREKIEKYWPPYILDQLANGEYSIWSIFKYLLPNLTKFYIDSRRDFLTVSNMLTNDKSFKDDMGLDAVLDAIKFIDEHYGDKIVKLYNQNDHKEDPDYDNVLFGIITLFNKSLVKAKFNAFKNTETLKAGKLRKREIKTKDAIGIMAPECLKEYTTIPLETELVKQAIEDLKSDGEMRNYSRSNQTLIDKVVNKVEGND